MLTWHNHVSITDRLNFVDIITFDDSIENCVQIVQEVDNL